MIWDEDHAREDQKLGEQSWSVPKYEMQPKRRMGWRLLLSRTKVGWAADGHEAKEQKHDGVDRGTRWVPWVGTRYSECS